MKQSTFNAYTKQLLAKATKVRNSKMVEYVGEIDRLSNFRKAANIQGISVPASVAGMMVKHTVSIYDMLKEEFEQPEESAVLHPLSIWEEKIIDHINYLLLLYSAIRETQNEVG